MVANFRKYLYLTLLTVTTVVIGFYRDFLFKNINALLKAWDFEMDYTMPPSLAYFKTLDYNGLSNLKWILTLCCAAIFMLISIAFVTVLFANKKFVKYTIWSYVILTAFSVTIMGLGFLFKKQHTDFYTVSRYLMGMAQSPILLMILIPAFKLTELQEKEIPK